MPIYILVTKLNSLSLVKERKTEGEKFLKLVKEKIPSVKWIAHYAVLGPYDFLDIYEAENEHEAAKVSLLSRKAGATFAESWTVIKYPEFLALLDDLN